MRRLAKQTTHTDIYAYVSNVSECFSYLLRAIVANARARIAFGSVYLDGFLFEIQLDFLVRANTSMRAERYNFGRFAE